MICGALRREVKGVPEWLITNGVNMGRWTRIFGVNCLADTPICQTFVGNTHADQPETTMHVFEVEEIV